MFLKAGCSQVKTLHRTSTTHAQHDGAHTLVLSSVTILQLCPSPSVFSHVSSLVRRPAVRSRILQVQNMSIKLARRCQSCQIRHHNQIRRPVIDPRARVIGVAKVQPARSPQGTPHSHCVQPHSPHQPVYPQSYPITSHGLLRRRQVCVDESKKRYDAQNGDRPPNAAASDIASSVNRSCFKSFTELDQKLSKSRRDTIWDT